MSGGGGGGGGGGWWNQLSTFDAEFKFAKKKKKKNFAKNFRAKMCLGMVFDFEYRVVRYTKYSEPQLLSMNCSLLLVCTWEGSGLYIDPPWVVKLPK